MSCITLLPLYLDCVIGWWSLQSRGLMTSGSPCPRESWPPFRPGIDGPIGCPSDHLLRPCQQLLTTRSFPRHLQLSCPNLPPMRQGPWECRAEHGKRGEGGLRPPQTQSATRSQIWTKPPWSDCTSLESTSKRYLVCLPQVCGDYRPLRCCLWPVWGTTGLLSVHAISWAQPTQEGEISILSIPGTPVKRPPQPFSGLPNQMALFRATQLLMKMYFL
jgi:hypothetical protein